MGQDSLLNISNTCAKQNFSFKISRISKRFFDHKVRTSIGFKCISDDLEKRGKICKTYKLKKTESFDEGEPYKKCPKKCAPCTNFWALSSGNHIIKCPFNQTGKQGGWGKSKMGMLTFYRDNCLKEVWKKILGFLMDLENGIEMFLATDPYGSVFFVVLISLIGK